MTSRFDLQADGQDSKLGIQRRFNAIVLDILYRLLENRPIIAREACSVWQYPFFPSQLILVTPEFKMAQNVSTQNNWMAFCCRVRGVSGDVSFVLETRWRASSEQTSHLWVYRGLPLNKENDHSFSHVVLLKLCIIDTRTWVAISIPAHNCPKSKHPLIFSWEHTVSDKG